MSTPPAQISTQDVMMATIRTALGSGDVVMKAVLAILDSVGCQDGIRGFLVKLLSSVPRILVTIGINHYVNNGDALGSLLKSGLVSLIKILFYKREVFRMVEPPTLDTFYGRRFQTLVNDHPRFMEITSSNTEVVIEYSRRFHSSFVQGHKDEVLAEFNRTDGATKFFFFSNNAYRNYPVGPLYSSTNYRNLERLVRTRVETSDLIGNHMPLSILINGEPGLGKSDFARYIASRNFLGSVYRADLSRADMISKAPSQIFEQIFSNVYMPAASLFLFDEIDKWLSLHTRESYDTKVSKLKEGDQPIDFEAHTASIKQLFLTGLLSVIERNNLSKPCVVIFCCNNFDTIFQNLDQTHYASLRNRLMIYGFERCDSQEIKDFLRYYNGRFSESAYHDVGIETHLNRLRDDISITHRDLMMVINRLMYVFSDIVDELNQRPVSPRSSPRPLPASSSLSVSPPLQIEDKQKAGDGDTVKECQICAKTLNIHDLNSVRQRSRFLRPPPVCILCFNSVPQKCSGRHGECENQFVLKDAFVSQSDSSTYMCQDCGKNWKETCKECGEVVRVKDYIGILKDQLCKTCYIKHHSCDACHGANHTPKEDSRLCHNCIAKHEHCYFCAKKAPLTHSTGENVAKLSCHECGTQRGMKLNQPLPVYTCRKCKACSFKLDFLCVCADCHGRAGAFTAESGVDVELTCHYCITGTHRFPAYEFTRDRSDIVNDILKITNRSREPHAMLKIYKDLSTDEYLAYLRDVKSSHQTLYPAKEWLVRGLMGARSVAPDAMMKNIDVYDRFLLGVTAPN